MRILVTNDDGIHAEGLAVAEAIACELSKDVWVCAPEVEQSGASRALTLSQPLRVRTIVARRFAVMGTPTDCVMLAIQTLMDAKPDLVLSGVNRGLNAGEDVTMSGTVAGAIEAMSLGVPAIALSQRMTYSAADADAPFAVARTFGAGLVARLVELGWPNQVILNINFPVGPVERVQEVEVTRQGFRDVRHRFAERRTDLRGREYFWQGFRVADRAAPAGTDLRAADEGRISITPLHIDLTHRPTVRALAGRVGGAIPAHKVSA
ncbi:MAG TPA: 5'/3'-nucleotidase SurE [Caulobacteraceae bacterium]|jgi:5'-nucleotidase